MKMKEEKEQTNKLSKVRGYEDDTFCTRLRG